MAGQRERDAHVGAGVEQAEQNPFALSHADRIAVSEHPLAERGRMVHDLEPVVGRRSLAKVLQADPLALPVVRGKENFAIVTSRTAGCRFDDQEAEFTGVGAPVEVAHRHRVAMIPARSRRLRGVVVGVGLAGLDDWRSLLGRAILERRQIEAVPMDEVGIARVVDDLDPDWPAFLEAKRRTWNRAVVGGRLDERIRSDLERDRRDADRVIDVLLGGGAGHVPGGESRRRKRARRRRKHGMSRGFQEAPASKVDVLSHEAVRAYEALFAPGALVLPFIVAEGFCQTAEDFGRRLEHCFELRFVDLVHVVPQVVNNLLQPSLHLLRVMAGIPLGFAGHECLL
jgi:hypothetical protein